MDLSDKGIEHGTIKDVYHEIKGKEEGGHIAHKFMMNKENQLRLVFWETTAGCNLECIHCRRLDISKEMMKDDLSTEESLSLIEQIGEAGEGIILVLSGGEPLFRPDIFHIARHAKKQGLTLALATNGTLVDKDMAKKIADAGIDRVSISLDGADADTHNAFRRLPGSFEAAIRGMKNLKDLGMEVQLNSTIARHNEHQVKELYQLAQDLGAIALHIFMLVPVGCGVQIAEDQMLEPEKYEEILNWFYDISKEGKIQTKATYAPHYFRIMRQRAKEEGIKVTPKTHGMAAMTKGCLAGSSVCFVSHRGQVFPCGYLPVEAGNIRKTHFKDIWENSEVFTNLRNPENLQGKCGICEYKKVCMGCRARAYYEKGNYMAEEPYCIYEAVTVRNHNQTEINA